MDVDLSLTQMGYIALANYKLLSFDKIPSTQDYALELIASGRATDHTAVLAAAQSAGRGRMRRTWVSHHGNVYISFIYASPERDARLSYAVAVAIAETIASFGIHPTIKWPNDIWVNGKKICGILLESILDRFNKVYSHVYSNVELLRENYFNNLLFNGQIREYADENGKFLGKIVDVENDGHLIIEDMEGGKRRYAFKEVAFQLGVRS